MKTMNSEQMECVSGGNIIDGACACAVIGLSSVGAGFRGGMFLLKMVSSFSMPVWGTVAIVVGSAGCLAYDWLKYPKA